MHAFPPTKEAAKHCILLRSIHLPICDQTLVDRLDSLNCDRSFPEFPVFQTACRAPGAPARNARSAGTELAGSQDDDLVITRIWDRRKQRGDEHEREDVVFKKTDH